jgi:Fur family ferric uptake transcriptional regulator
MIKKILKNKKLRVTPFREEVLAIFLNHSNAISITDIETGLAEFDRITLYRTIKSFIENGVIHEIVMPGDIKKLALCPESCSSENHTHTKQHLHFRCNQCENIYCKDLNEFPTINIPGFQLNSIELQGNGICKNCLNS